MRFPGRAEAVGWRYNSVSWPAANRSDQAPARDGCENGAVAVPVMTLVRSGEKGNGGVWQRRPAVVGQARSRVLRVRLNRPAQRRRSGSKRSASDAERDEGSSLPIVVGIGASAGGLEAFTELLSHLPDDTGMAFVLIQHLDPKHESHLTELLSKASKMPVSEVKGETRAEANHVYVIPPRCNLGISDGVLHTPPRPDSGRNMPIDSFLRALAADRGSKALGVVLSGTASDGTLGLQAIKAAGGITFAQESANREVRRHAAKRHRRRCGGFCAAAGRNRAATGGHRARFSGRDRASGGD